MSNIIHPDNPGITESEQLNDIIVRLQADNARLKSLLVAKGKEVAMWEEEAREAKSEVVRFKAQLEESGRDVDWNRDLWTRSEAARIDVIEERDRLKAELTALRSATQAGGEPRRIPDDSELAPYVTCTKHRQFGITKVR